MRPLLRSYRLALLLTCLVGCSPLGQPREWGTPLHWAAAKDNAVQLEARLRGSLVAVDARDRSDRTPLMIAASEGKSDNVRLLLANGADLHARDASERTPLIHAATEGWPECVALLLAAGSDVHAESKYGSTALHVACRTATSSYHGGRVQSQVNVCKTVALLIDAGADVEALDDLGFTPLLITCWPGDARRMEQLLRAGSDPNRAGPGGRTPLMCAGSNIELVELLLAAGADPNARNDRGRTALMRRVPYGAGPQVITRLVEAGADLEAADSDGMTALELALEVETAHWLRQLIDAGADTSPLQWSELHLAAATGDASRVQPLAARGVDVNVRDRDGRTPLMWAARYAGYSAAVEALLTAGASVELRDRDGRTALSYAASHPNEREAQVLVRFGADVDVQDEQGRTPLMYASQQDIGEFVGRVLVGAGAGLDIQDELGGTARSVA